jgi:hypothetical protein
MSLDGPVPDARLRSTGLPGRVAGLLRAVGFEQAAVGLRRFVIEVDPADRLDAGQALSDTQPVGDPLGLKQGFHEEIELEGRSWSALSTRR